MSGLSLWISAAMIASGAVAATGSTPTGAKIEPSGFATIEKAPHPPYDLEPPPSENRPRSEAEWYARDQGISLAEAEKRYGEQHAIMPAFERLLARLREGEPGNFTSARMVHAPDWATNSTSSAIQNARLRATRSIRASRPGWRATRKRSFRLRSSRGQRGSRSTGSPMASAWTTPTAPPSS